MSYATQGTNETSLVNSNNVVMFIKDWNQLINVSQHLFKGSVLGILMVFFWKVMRKAAG